MTLVLGKPIFLPSLLSKRVPNKCLHVPQMNLGSYLLLCLPTQFQIIAVPKCHITELLLQAAGSSFIKDDSPPLGLQKHCKDKLITECWWPNGGTTPSLTCRVLSSGRSWDRPRSPQALVPERVLSPLKGKHPSVSREL